MRAWFGILLLGLCMAGIAGCQVAEPADAPSTRRPSSTLEGSAVLPTTITTTAATTTTATTAARVGNKPAPFDPCAVLTWADLPPELRHPTLKAPIPWRGPESNPTLLDAGCKLDNTLIAIDTDSSDATDQRAFEVFTVVVAWSANLTYDPKTYSGPAQPATFAGRPGLIRLTTGHNGVSEIRQCYIAMRTTSGAAALQVANNRFRIDECALATQLAELLATRIP